jgi:protein gp37
MIGVNSLIDYRLAYWSLLACRNKGIKPSPAPRQREFQMQKTKIEWCDYTINPVKGLCPMACSFCYARRMYKRFKWDETIRYDKSVWDKISTSPRGSRVFVGSTMELFHDANEQYMGDILDHVESMNWYTFIFLTKQPGNLLKWSPYPKNCHIGVSWTGDDISRPLRYLKDVQASVKFISFEPLLQFPEWWTADSLKQAFEKAGISWLIIGQRWPATKKTTPQVEWIKEIVEAGDKAGIPIFLKNNLRPLLLDFEHPWAYKDGYYTSEEHPNIDRRFRQELPEAKG